MLTGLRYSAFNYLNEWIAFDKQSRQALGYADEKLDGAEQARKQLVEVAGHYGVIRNFGLKYERSIPRLEPVWHALKVIKSPTTDEDAKACVNEFVDALKHTYEKDLTSAASKFLWMRFGSPIVICDTLAWGWMRENAGLQSNGDYSTYYDAWRTSFRKYRTELSEVRLDLRRVKDFVLAPGVTDLELESLVSSEWFLERVFDRYLVDAMDPRNGVERYRSGFQP